MKEMRIRPTYKILVEKTADKRSFGRPMRRQKDNIKMDLKEIWEGVNWIHVAQNRN
jgi:hypothetical protein